MRELSVAFVNVIGHDVPKLTRRPCREVFRIQSQINKHGHNHSAPLAFSHGYRHTAHGSLLVTTGMTRLVQPIGVELLLTSQVWLLIETM